jgi:nucleoid DNA-binding protein
MTVTELMDAVAMEIQNGSAVDIREHGAFSANDRGEAWVDSDWRRK